MAERILILGVGNILLGDEGFGVHAVRYLQEKWQWPENIKLVDGGTLGLMLMAELLECDQAIILDIALGGKPAGTFYRIEENDLNAALSLRQSMHQTGISDVLVSCDLAGHRPKATVFAMEPFDMQNLRPELTAGARAKLADFCLKVRENLVEMDVLKNV